MEHSDFVYPLALPTDFHAELAGGGIDEVPHAVLAAGGNHEVFRRVLLEHEPLHFNVVFGVAPVAQRIHVAEIKKLLQAELDASERAGDLARDERLAAARRFMV